MQMQYTVKHMEVNTVLGKEILTFTTKKKLRVKTWKIKASAVKSHVIRSFAHFYMKLHILSTDDVWKDMVV